ncbi:MAG: CHAT domain-containing protein [Verrucomicrobia bacterium]|nr:CHAT domain-containing protein [Verrucomicrobiota bacterium]
MNEVDWYHKECIAQLKATGDWVGLLRHYVGHHGYEPAIRGAIDLLQAGAQGADSFEARLADFLMSRNNSTSLKQFWAFTLNKLNEQKPEVQHGLLFVHSFLLGSMFGTSSRDFVEESDLLANITVSALAHSIEMAESIGDFAVATTLILVESASLRYRLSKEDRLGHALAAFEYSKFLAGKNRKIFLPRLADCARLLAYARAEMAQITEATVSGLDAFELTKELYLQNGVSFLPQFADSTKFMGDIVAMSGNHKVALKWRIVALNLFRRLAREGLDDSPIPQALTLSSVGESLLELSRYSGALKAFYIATEKLSTIEGSKSRSVLATRFSAQFGVARCLFALGQHTDSVETLERLIQEYTALSQPRQIYLCGVAARVYFMLSQLYVFKVPRFWESFGLRAGSVGRYVNAIIQRFLTVQVGCLELDALENAATCFELDGEKLKHDLNRSVYRESVLPIYEKMVSCSTRLLKLGSFNFKAERCLISACEGLRQRMILDRFRTEVFNPNAPEEIIEDWRLAFQRVQSARMELDNFELNWSDSRLGDKSGSLCSTTGAGDPNLQESEDKARVAAIEALSRKLQEAEIAHRIALTCVQYHDPDFNPIGGVAISGIQDARILFEKHPSTVFIEYVVTDDNGWAVLIWGKRVRVVRLSSVSKDAVDKLFALWMDGYTAASTDSEMCQLEIAAWGDGLKSKLSELARILVWPVLKEIKWCESKWGLRASSMIICPHLHMNWFPFHAMPIDSSGSICLIDKYQVSYTPSLSILCKCAGRRRGAGRRYMIGDPTEDLVFMGVATEAFRHRDSKAIVCHGGSATAEFVVATSGEMESIDVWAHIVSASDPMASGIVFGSGAPLRLDDIYKRVRFPLSPNIVLNGCDSGTVAVARTLAGDKGLTRVEQRMKMDFDGLPMGFLFAGASSVVSTLWKVYDLSAALLMDRYQQEMASDGATPVAALRRASLWLRYEICNGEQLVKVGEDLLRRVPAAWADRFPERMEHCRWYLGNVAAEHPDDPPFASPIHWASHFVTGWCWDPVDFTGKR